MIEIFETCQTKSIAKQTNRDESLLIRSIVWTVIIWRHRRANVWPCVVIQDAMVSSCSTPCRHDDTDIVVMMTLTKLRSVEISTKMWVACTCTLLHWSVTFLKGFYAIKRCKIFWPQENGGTTLPHTVKKICHFLEIFI